MTTVQFGRRALLIASLVSTTLIARADNHELLLRVQDAVGAPGGQAVISLRTYASRPVGQGTICLAMRGVAGAPPPLGAFKGATVFGAAADVIDSFQISEQDGELIVDLSFRSASASINRIDGPFAALYFEISPDAVPGSVTDVRLDLAQTELFDEFGQRIALELRGGELEIRHPDLPFEVEAEADVGDLPGELVTLSLQTSEPFRIAGGQVALRYDDRELPGSVQLLQDPRYGEAMIKLDGYPGLAVFKIVGAAATFNELPGSILSVQVRRHPLLHFANEPTVELDLSMTYLFDLQGNIIPIALDNAAVLSDSRRRELRQNR